MKITWIVPETPAASGEDVAPVRRFH